MARVHCVGDGPGTRFGSKKADSRRTQPLSPLGLVGPVEGRREAALEANPGVGATGFVGFEGFFQERDELVVVEGGFYGEEAWR